MAKVLAEDIIFGRLEPGARLTEDKLIARFSVTRHFIDQALVELDRTGIAVREHNKSVSVRWLSSREVRQIYDVRELLQRQAALLIPLPAAADLDRRLERCTRSTAASCARGTSAGCTKPTTRFTSRCSLPAAIPIWWSRSSTTCG